MDNEQLLRSLYDEASQTMDLGSYDNYLEKLKVPETRKSFFDMISQDGIDVGGYDRLSNVVDEYYQAPTPGAKKKYNYPIGIPFAPRAYIRRWWKAARDGYSRY